MERDKLKKLLESTSSTDKNKTQRILEKILGLYLKSNEQYYYKRFELEFFNSKDIERLLTLLENSSVSIRKLTLLVVGLVLMNPLSKIFFIEKCGMPIDSTRFFLTRLKYILSFSERERHGVKNLQKVMSFLKHSGTGPKDIMFWYIPLCEANTRISENFKPSLHEFRIKNMLNEEGRIELNLVPDPIFNLCGVELCKEDIKLKIDHYVYLQKKTDNQFTQSSITGNAQMGAPLTAKIPRSSFQKGVPRFLVQSSIQKKQPRLSNAMDMRMKDINKGSGMGNSSLYFRSTIEGTGGNNFTKLNEMSNSTLKQKLQGNLKNNPIKLGKFKGIKDNQKRYSNIDANMQFGTSSTHEGDRRKTFNLNPNALHSSIHQKLKNQNNKIRLKDFSKQMKNFRGGIGSLKEKLTSFKDPKNSSLQQGISNMDSRDLNQLSRNQHNS